MRVLIVDDDEDNTEVLILALTTFHGWNVQGVNSGAQALRICRFCKLDAVVLDVGDKRARGAVGEPAAAPVEQQRQRRGARPARALGQPRGERGAQPGSCWNAA